MYITAEFNMKTAIISPHTDDALFSLGSMMSLIKNGREVTIISPFAGIPNDPTGKEKHITLRQEHRNACITAGVEYINGNFFDDVYGPQNKEELVTWLSSQLGKFQEIYVPLGIHHPDHVLIRDIFVEYFEFQHFYEELPYRVLYPQLASEAAQKFTTGMRRFKQPHLPSKEPSVKMYKSQTAPHLFKLLFVDEFVWSK